MTRLISKAESYEIITSALSQINFSSFDFFTIKNSLIEYVKLHYSETFNDYIESSEFIAILEIFAYVIELYNYRLDINASENFLSTAERKQSVLKIAKFLSYNASRNIPGRGLVKIQTIKTTEDVFDLDGINLNNKTIIWNDPNNDKWKEQFLLVLNRVLKQNFGTVLPNERKQVDDVLFELYEINNNPLVNGVFQYSTNVSGQSLPMELVPTDLNDFGPLERRPDRNGSFSLLYGSDGLGDGSDTTGFFMFTKQGSIQVQREIFDGITPNQTFDIAINDINDTDVWVNNIDPDTNDIIDNDSTSERSGEWHEVDITHAQNIIFNTNPNRNKYEIESLENDQIRIIFGDGEFSDIPNGSFDIWFRTSVNDDVVIPKNAINNEPFTFNYIGRTGNTETLTLSFTLINSIQNNAETETLEHVRKTAPSVYYTQDRMVNGKDYNTFMLQDTSILKLKAINRTFIGDSKYISWHDPRESYESVKLFGDDLALYYKSNETTNNVVNESSASSIFFNHIQPLLSSNDFFTLLTSRGVQTNDIRTSFTTDETNTIIAALEAAALNPEQTIHLFYSVAEDEWVHMVEDAPIGSLVTENVFSSNLPFTNSSYDHTQVLFDITYPWGINPTIHLTDNTIVGEGLIKIEVKGNFEWNIVHKTERIVAHSYNTRFWNSNDANDILSFDTLLSNRDEIVILKANQARNDGNLYDTLFNENKRFDVIGQELVEANNIPNTGLIDIHQLSVLPIDTNNDNIPDNMDLPNIINPRYILEVTNPLTDIPNGIVNSDAKELPFVVRYGDITTVTTPLLEYYYEGALVGSDATTPPNADDLVDVIRNADTATIDVSINEYVYFQKEVIDLETGEYTWVPKETSNVIINSWVSDTTDEWKREIGRFPMNFLWMHRTTNFNLIDPAATNIIDVYIISRAYYTSVLEYLNDVTNNVPEPTTSLQLRSDYSEMIESKMISDTLILHSGNFKYLFGSKALPELQAKFKVIRKETSTLTDNEIKVKLINVVKNFFDINDWQFGETFYMTELSSKIHIEMLEDIKSIVLVPVHTNNLFGDLFVVQAREDEIFQPHINVNNVEIVQNYTNENIKQGV